MDDPVGEGGTALFDFDETRQTVYREINKLNEWLKDNVKSSDGRGLSVDQDDRRSYAMHLALILKGEMVCECSRKNCAGQHYLATQAESGLSVPAFVRRAVIGPMMTYIANSIDQGMLFSFLSEDHKLLKVKVEFKKCASPGCEKSYEGMECPYCYEPFAPDTTPLVGVPWLVVEGVYLPVRRWHCGREGDSKEGQEMSHYYNQDRCIEEMIYDQQQEWRYRVVHTDPLGHDICPLETCAQKHTQHALRGSTLWIHAIYINVADAESGKRVPLFLEGLEAGMQQAIEAFDDLQTALVGLLGETPIDIAEALFSSTPPVTDPSSINKICRQLKRPRTDHEKILNSVSEVFRLSLKHITHELEVRGIDQESVHNYLKVGWEVFEDENQSEV